MRHSTDIMDKKILKAYIWALRLIETSNNNGEDFNRTGSREHQLVNYFEWNDLDQDLRFAKESAVFVGSRLKYKNQN